MHQEAFAARVGLSVATVRSIESGRRPLRPLGDDEDHCLEQIFVTLKAVWNEREGRWTIFGTKWDYEKRHAELFQHFDPEDPYVDDHTLHRLTERLLDLFDACDREQRLALLLHLSRYLEKTARGFQLKANLKRTEPVWVRTMGPPITSFGRKLDKDSIFRPVYADNAGNAREISPHEEEAYGRPGIFDFRNRRTFKPEDYPAKTAEEAKAMRDAMKQEMQRQKRDA